MFSTRSSDIPYVCITVAWFGEIECVLYTLFRHSLRVYYGGVFWRDKEFIPNDTGEREVRLDCVFCSFVFVLCVCVGCECARERVRMCVCGLRVPSRESWVVFLDETTYF